MNKLVDRPTWVVHHPLKFPHGFMIEHSEEGYTLTCNGNFVSFNVHLSPLVAYLVKQLEGRNQ